MTNKKNDGVAIYHFVKENEGFNESAQFIFALVQEAERKCPGQPRHLYLDIESHRNKVGGFDSDILELQQDFVIGFMLQYLTTASTPLLTVENKKQNNNIPEILQIVDE